MGHSNAETLLAQNISNHYSCLSNHGGQKPSGLVSSPVINCISLNKILNTTAVSLWPHIYSASSWSQHTLHLTSLWSKYLHHSVTHHSFCHASPHLWNQLPTSLRISHPNYSSPSQRPSSEHAGLTCCTLLSSPITFHCFTLSSKLTFSAYLILHLSLFLSVGLISWL